MYVREVYDLRKSTDKDPIIRGPDGFYISFGDIANYEVDEIVDELNRLRLEIVELKRRLM